MKERDSSAAGQRLTQWLVSVWTPCPCPAGSAWMCPVLEVRIGRWKCTPGELQMQRRSLHKRERRSKWDTYNIKILLHSFFFASMQAFSGCLSIPNLWTQCFMKALREFPRIWHKGENWLYCGDQGSLSTASTHFKPLLNNSSDNSDKIIHKCFTG